MFRFIDVTHASPGERLDVIGDFERGSDTIDLRRIDAQEGVSGNQEFEFVGDAKFSGRSGELRFNSGILRADTDGDARADFAVAVVDVARMSEGDFFL